MQENRDMPLGIQDFPLLIESGCVYVDKTQFISKLEKLGRAWFLTRPRRFGKSLFLSTLEAYFKGRKELFKGLFIEKFKAEKESEWQSYPVLKLDLNAKEYTKKEHLITILNDHLEEWGQEYDVHLAAVDPDSAFAKIILSIYKKYKKRVVVLIDEYDTPLLATLDNQELQEKYRSILKAFYSVIKSLNGCIHFAFLTGITKFSKVSIFSDLNNLIDLSLDDRYSNICGITEEELKTQFSIEIDALAQKYHKTQSEMLDILRQKYDGYRFSEKDESVYNPFSIFNVFDKNKLGEYWFESGTPTFMAHLLRQKRFKIPDLESSVKISARDIDVYRADGANLVSLLFQSGYLTIKDYDGEFDMYKLGFPNEEVRYAFMECLMNEYIKTGDSFNSTIIDDFVNGMKSGDIESVLIMIKAFLASIPYDSLPPDKLFLREQNYQTAIYLIFYLMGQYVRTEIYGAVGRSDVEVETSNAIYIFEFKVGGEPFDAIEQIKERGYANRYLASPKNIVLIGASIAKDERTLGGWQIEKMEKYKEN